MNAPSVTTNGRTSFTVAGGCRLPTKEFHMSGFLDKAKDMAEGVKDKVGDKVEDSVNEKLNIGDEIPVEDVADP